MQIKFTKLNDPRWEIAEKRLEIQGWKRKYPLRTLFNGLSWNHRLTDVHIYSKAQESKI